MVYFRRVTIFIKYNIKQALWVKASTKWRGTGRWKGEWEVNESLRGTEVHRKGLSCDKWVRRGDKSSHRREKKQVKTIQGKTKMEEEEWSRQEKFVRVAGRFGSGGER